MNFFARRRRGIKKRFGSHIIVVKFFFARGAEYLCKNPGSNFFLLPSLQPSVAEPVDFSAVLALQNLAPQHFL
jgi:hypothetical protein